MNRIGQAEPVLEQLDFFFPRFRSRPPGEDVLHIGSGVVPLRLVRNTAARHYILRLGDDGAARVTVPRGGSLKGAREFVQQHLGWLEKQLRKRSAQPARPTVWVSGTEIFFRGEMARLFVAIDGKKIHFADQSLIVHQTAGDLRPAVERHLAKVAARELVARTAELASRHRINVHRIVVRNQRSRWGSCSTRRTISLNWRLIQAPPFVSDYIILHELMHLREMNHSKRFWRHVEGVCPDYDKAEAWLNSHVALLR